MSHYATSPFEDEVMAKPEPTPEWESDDKNVNRLVYVLDTFTEQYPLRSRVLMGRMRFKGTMNGDLTLSIDGPNICPGVA